MERYQVDKLKYGADIAEQVFASDISSVEKEVDAEIGKHTKTLKHLDAWKKNNSSYKSFGSFQKSESKGASENRCWNCGKFGHTKKDCKSPIKDKGNKSKSESSDSHKKD